MYEIDLIIKHTSVSEIQDYIKHIIKNRETSRTNYSIHIYINRINNRFTLELQTTETMKLFDSTKKLMNKTKNGGNPRVLGVNQVALVQYNLVDNQYQQKPKVLYTFTHN